jgi:type III secretion protein U
MSEKTEQPTPKRLREAREKGQVAKSRDLVQTLLFIAILATLLMRNETNAKILGTLMVLPGNLYSMPFLVALRELGTAALSALMVILLPLFGALVLTAIAANVVQSGFLFSLKALVPDLSRLSPAAQLKNMFSAKNLVEFMKSVTKIAVLGIALYVTIRAGLGDLLHSSSCGLGCALLVGDRMLVQVLAVTTVVFLAVSAADYFFQYRHHIKELRMTKEEVKQEYKEMEGDPHIKRKRKELHRELSNQNAAERVRTASVLVTNPTHIAVALYYEAELTPLPTVLAMAEGSLALRMMAIAREENIPIMQNIPLARGLYADAEIDQYIPSALIEPVAEVLRWLQTLER